MKREHRIYLDNNATTKLDPRVLETILPLLGSSPHNPSSMHFFGQEAKGLLQEARREIGLALQVASHEILFTSGGTESINLLIRGFLTSCSSGHVISSNLEHSCVEKTLQIFQKKGLEIDFLPGGLRGAVSPSQVEMSIRPSTCLIVLSAVNHETGVKLEMEEIAEIAAKKKIPLVIDGVALLGKEKFSIPPGVSAMGFSGHKLHAPQGSGFVFLRSSYKIAPILTGGDQEFKLRAGTENLPAIVGLAKAVTLLQSELPEATNRMNMLRDKLEADLIQKISPVIINGGRPRIANTSNLSFPGILAEDLLIALDMAGIAASHGSACSSGALEPSRILTQMGIPLPIARSAIRFSLSRETTLEEINYTIDAITHLVRKFR